VQKITLSAMQSQATGVSQLERPTEQKRGLGQGPEDGQELTDSQVAEVLQAEEVCMNAPYTYIT
jgi:hypothetical protein